MVLIKDLEAKKGFDVIKAEVVSVSEARTVRDGTLTVADAQIKDESGSVKLTLWNDEVGKVSVGDVVTITKGWTNEFQGELSVSAGKFGEMAVEKGSGSSESSEEVAPEVKAAVEDDII